MNQWSSQCGRAQLYCGDCLAVMPTLPADSVDAIVTDPPYGLSFMGKDWDRGVPGEHFWREAIRVAKPGAHLLAFGGTRTFHRLTCAIEDAGWEIRDCVMWVYGSGFPKSLDVSKAIDKAAGVQFKASPASGVGFMGPDGRGGYNVTKNQLTRLGESTDAARQWSGWGTALKPSHEPIVWATKPLTLVPIDVILQAESNIGSLICLSLSHAKHAESLLRSSPNGLAGAAGSALLIAAAHRGLSSGELSGVMAMFKSPETAKTIWSIVESWSCILAAVSERQNTFTTSTVLKTTTALKTFNCLISEIIREVITPDGERKLGWLLSAPIVETSSSGASVMPARLTSVREVVSLLTERNIASIAESSFMPAARAGSSVLLDAITSTAESIRPSAELICVARKPLIGTVAANVMKYGTGAINVDGCRVGTDVVGWAGAGAGAGTWNAETCGLRKPGDARPVTGRWPANLIHDGSDEVVGLFPNDGDASAARFFYCAKADGEDREHGNTHATVKPNDLMRYLCKLIAPKDAIILDPFMGSGSTGVAAIQMNNRFIGIELGADHFEICKRRVAAAFDTFPLLNPKGNQ